MSKCSAKARQIKGRGKPHHGPSFTSIPHYVTQSTSYHGLSCGARSFLIEIASRYNGSNNGYIAFGQREAKYELRRGADSVSQYAREVDDARLAQPTKVGAWRGRQVTEWRLTWRRCDKTGDLPRSDWPARTPYTQQLLLPPPRPKPAMTDAERARRYRERKADPTRPHIDEPEPVTE